MRNHIRYDIIIDTNLKPWLIEVIVLPRHLIGRIVICMCGNTVL